MNYHMAKNYIPSTSKKSTICSSCEQEIPSYYSLQKYRGKEHGAKQRKPSDTAADQLFFSPKHRRKEHGTKQRNSGYDGRL